MEAETHAVEVASVSFGPLVVNFIPIASKSLGKATDQGRLSARSSPARQRDLVLQLVSKSDSVPSPACRQLVDDLEYEDRWLNGE